jgi:hypothetical protein
MMSTSSSTIQRRGAAGPTSATSNGTTTNTTAGTAASNALFTSTSAPTRPRRKKAQAQLAWNEAVPYMIRILVLLVALFCLVDMYYLFDLAEHGKLQDVKPVRRIKEQLDQMLHRKNQLLAETAGDQPEVLGGELGYPDQKALARWKKQLLQEARKDEEEEKERARQAEENKKYDLLTWDEVDADKEEIFEILEQAGISRKSLDKATRAQLPTWTHVLKEYGDHPLVYGLERCENFTSNRDMSVSFFGIAGTFNSGTNLLAELLIQNCQITERMEKFGELQKGIRWQVPWGKHTPVQFREEHVTTTDKEVPLENSFPMITIRDPYSWLLSMCRHPYAARWQYDAYHCPNVVDYETGIVSNVFTYYKESMVPYKSLPHMWNQWYLDYLAVDFPRVLVRFEDLLFFGKEVTQTLCECGGGVPRQPEFKHIQESAKLGTAAHGSHKTGLVQALIRYGNVQNRTMSMTPADIAFTRDHFDASLMKMFNYRHPS